MFYLSETGLSRKLTTLITFLDIRLCRILLAIRKESRDDGWTLIIEVATCSIQMKLGCQGNSPLG